jgi:hypothetical protein
VPGRRAAEARATARRSAGADRSSWSTARSPSWLAIELSGRGRDCPWRASRSSVTAAQRPGSERHARREREQVSLEGIDPGHRARCRSPSGTRTDGSGSEAPAMIRAKTLDVAAGQRVQFTALTR